MEKIREINPDRIVTDCLSCRLQFNPLLPYEVVHPIEVLRDAYAVDTPVEYNTEQTSLDRRNMR
jgi:Fe-S oxidoreductase